MANTVKFGSGNWAAKKDSILAYNDENANFKPLPFTTSRASTATRINKAGLIEKVENGIARVDYLGNTKGALLTEPQSTNLIQYSEAFGQSYWTKSGASIEGDPSTAGSELITGTDSDMSGANNWIQGIGTPTFNINSTVSNKMFINFTTGNQQVKLPNKLTIGKTYLISLTVRLNTGTATPVQIGGFTSNSSSSESFNLTPTSSTTTYIGNIYAESTYLSIGIISANNNGSDYEIDNVSVKEVQGFASPSANTPLGAFKLVENSSNSVHTIRSQETTVSGVAHTFSLLAKADGRDFIKMRLENAGVGSGQANVWFDVKNGVVGTIGSGTAKIELISDGWYRCSITGTTNGTSYLSRVYLADANGSDSYTGNGTSGVYIFGAQLEQKPYSTSYIPNYGESAGVTRLGETNSQNLSKQVSLTEGVLFVDYTPLGNGINGLIETTTNIISHNSTVSTLVIIKQLSNAYVAGVFASGTFYSVSTQNFALGVRVKIALSYKSGDLKIYVNGVLENTNTATFTLPIGLADGVRLMDTASAYNAYGGKGIMREFKLFNTLLTNSELIALTTI